MFVETMMCLKKRMEENFLNFKNIALAIQKIHEYQFKRIVLQIPDELLSKCVLIYDYFTENLQNGNDVELFLTADSTFGSSVDDISAEHVNSDLLIYFGSDTSGSCSIPMMVIPQQFPLDINSVTQRILTYMKDNSDYNAPTNALLVVDPSYHHLMDSLHQLLSPHFSCLIAGKLPLTSNLVNWTPESSKQMIDKTYENIGGLQFLVDDLADIQTVLYIGNKREQLISILLRMSSCNVLSCTPNTSDLQISRHVGVNSREYRERYAGVLRVKDASIIGLIIGSMSLTGELTRIIIKQLTELIEAAGKKCYSFVMGRINESKLCNFPEIDVFCLLSNDDNARVPAKTFHVPVVTPYELELGLGAREWECIYLTTLTGKGLYSTSTDEEFQMKLEKVQNTRVRSTSSDSSKSESLDEINIALTQQCQESVKSSSTISIKSESAMTVFNSAAADYLSNRDYRGLEPSIPLNMTTEIAQGQYGIASSYQQHPHHHHHEEKEEKEQQSTTPPTTTSLTTLDQEIKLFKECDEEK